MRQAARASVLDVAHIYRGSVTHALQRADQFVTGDPGYAQEPAGPPPIGRGEPGKERHDSRRLLYRELPFPGAAFERHRLLAGATDRPGRRSSFLRDRRFECLTVGRDILHGTGVEPVIQTVSVQKSLSRASSRIMRLTSGSAARSRLL
jgi:hypothetical protein